MESVGAHGCVPGPNSFGPARRRRVRPRTRNPEAGRNARPTSTRRPRATAFTLIEVMMAVLLMALLASAAALSFSGSLRIARSADALETLRSFDAAARDIARRSGHEARIVFDFSNNTLARREGTDLQSLRSQVRLPSGYRVNELRVAGRSFSDGEAVVDCSALGLSRSYAVHLAGPGFDQWVLFAGLTGEMTQEQDETSAQTILDKAAPMAYRSWDSTLGNNAH